MLRESVFRDSQASVKRWIYTGLLAAAPGQTSWVFLHQDFDAWDTLQENPSHLQSGGIYWFELHLQTAALFASIRWSQSRYSHVHMVLYLSLQRPDLTWVRLATYGTIYQYHIADLQPENSLKKKTTS